MKNKLNSKGIFELSLFLITSCFLLFRPIADMDEIWNYNFGYNICNGMLPYIDFNCILTPLSMYISGAFLSVFGNTLFVFRLLSIILLATTFYCLFRLLWFCGNNRFLAFACASFLFAICYLIWIYNYNNLNLLLIILALLIELKLDNQENISASHYFFIGLLYGLIFLSKQSVGVFFLAYNTVLCVIEWFSNKIKSYYLVIRMTSSLLPLILFIIFLLLSGSSYEFWDYAIAGLGTFSLKITYFEYITSSVFDFVVGITPLIITSFSLVSILKNTSLVSRRFHIISLVISWIGVLVAYPLCDYIHMCIGIVPFSVCAICCLNIKSFKRWENVVCVLVACSVLLCACSLELKTTDNYKKCELTNYEGLIISKKLESHIVEVNQFIIAKGEKGIDVLIVDSNAAAYLLPLNKYYKDFSLLNQGNLGTKTVSDLLLQNNVLYLVRSDRSSLNRQSHFDLIEYIVTQYTKIGEVSGFEVYEKK